MFPSHSVWQKALRSGFSVIALCALAACADGPSTQAASSAESATQKPQYTTYSDQFVALQSAGLRGDYAAFASALKASNVAEVTAELLRSFGGKPFDVYTRTANFDNSRHRRAVELRSTSGRLYLFVEMTKVPGGWIVAGHELDRNRSLIMAKL